MSNPPEFWAFAIANIVSAGFGIILTVLSFIAYRQTGRVDSFRNATIGFGLITIGLLVEPSYQIGWKADYNLLGTELLALQTVEAVIFGLGLGMLFYSIYTHRRTVAV